MRISELFENRETRLSYRVNLRNDNGYDWTVGHTSHSTDQITEVVANGTEATKHSATRAAIKARYESKRTKQTNEAEGGPELKVSRVIGNKVTAGDGVEIDLDKVDVDQDPITKEISIEPSGTVGSTSPKQQIRPGSTVKLGSGK